MLYIWADCVLICKSSVPQGPLHTDTYSTCINTDVSHRALHKQSDTKWTEGSEHVCRDQPTIRPDQNLKIIIKQLKNNWILEYIMYFF